MTVTIDICVQNDRDATPARDSRRAAVLILLRLSGRPRCLRTVKAVPVSTSLLSPVPVIPEQMASQRLYDDLFSAEVFSVVEVTTTSHMQPIHASTTYPFSDTCLSASAVSLLMTGVVRGRGSSWWRFGSFPARRARRRPAGPYYGNGPSER